MNFGWEERRYQRVIEQRLLYRLALGQPHQEDVIDALAARGLAQDGRVLSSGAFAILWRAEKRRETRT
jgi:hypothetical protein